MHLIEKKLALGILVQFLTNSFAHTSLWTQRSECGTTNVRVFFLYQLNFQLFQAILGSKTASDV